MSCLPSFIGFAAIFDSLTTPPHHAAASGAPVLPVYVASEWRERHGWTGPKRQQFLCENLQSLAGNLASIQFRLVIRAGDAVEQLERLVKETGAGALYFNLDPDPFGRQIEGRVREVCRRLGLACHGFKDAVLHGAGEVLTGAGEPYRVYTPYSRNWLSLPKAPVLPRVTSLGSAPAVASLPLPTLATWGLTLPVSVELLPAGERAARERMKRFLESGALARYGQERDLPAGDANSGLSQDLRFGLISIRELFQRSQAYAQAHPAAAGSVQTFVKELAWREFYMAILQHYPEVLRHEFNADFRQVTWPGTPAHFQAWCEGRTGFPIVDAGMRQLVTTGLMHNRVRMIVAMFLTKDLHLDWRLGEQFFSIST